MLSKNEKAGGVLPGLSLPVAVLVAAKNEEVNLPKCLASLVPAQQVIVLDSQSTDGTAEISESFQAELVQFSYAGGYPKKRQWAIDSLAITTEWILLIDADEEVPAELWEEIASVTGEANPADAYLVTKQFHFMGRQFRFGGFSHAAILLFRPGVAEFEELDYAIETGLDMEVHERLLVTGRIGKLETPLVHNDFRGLSAYIDRHNQYSSWEAGVRFARLERGAYGEKSIGATVFGNVQEQRRFLKNIAIRVPFEPALWFLYHYFLRLGFLEGRAGLIASQLRAAYISQVRAKIIELKQRR
jgi:glycosyltransferase involved in cell wall biosynthesis